MSYLKRQDPELYARYLQLRHVDPRLCDVFNDLEFMAQNVERDQHGGSVVMADILAELVSELRIRVAKCETGRNTTKE
ncbi:hypothetical protein [Ruegeria lacuscaerulensis]|uniref:hypothetical protein n=1 Tax=Ruegeria lacuscaerulensis TaxID=55218 RepID=UPI00147C98A4|nr:hypothetical protein [Ruegeria lacuscaerulensis]